MAYAGKVTPDLMHTAGNELHLQKGAGNFPVSHGRLKSPQKFIKSFGFLPGFGPLIPQGFKLEPDYSLLRTGDAGTYSQVLFDNGPVLFRRGIPPGKKGGKTRGGFPGFGDKDYSRGIPVKPMNQKGPRGIFFRQD